ncbi:MAG: MotA/TolQ/ExbB proton channel family protein, partial [Acidobacteriota bacterium]
MGRISSAADWLLRAPMLWGSLLSLAFYAALRTGGLDLPLLHRYFDAHPVEWVSTQLFFVGLAALGIRLFGVVGQFSALKADPLGPVPAGGQPVSDAPELLHRLEAADASVQDSLLVRRLRAGLEYVRDTDSADTLEDHLRRLEDVELERLSAGYGLPRLVRATLPIVGMLGTVIG